MFGDRKEKQLTELADKLLADGSFTEAEQHQFMEFAASLGVNLNQYPAILNRIVIANANAGRFPGAVPPFHIICKAGEEVYIETFASLLKEVADRQWQGGNSGVSFRVMKVVRLRSGQTQGHMQQVGTKTVVSDSGTLSVTSSRVVFSGKTTTQESLYGDIVNIRVNVDGITLAVSKGHEIATHAYATGGEVMLASIINAAIHRQTAAAPVSPVGMTSPDGAWRWDGTAWQPVVTNASIPEQSAPISNVGTISPDGAWRWDGQAWQPVASPRG